MESESVGDELCCLANLEKFSVTLQNLLSEVYRCTATVILPDLEVGVVRLVGSVGEEGVVLECDILETVLPVFDILVILWPVPTPEANNNVLVPETGLLQVC